MGKKTNNSIIKVAVLIPSAQVGGAEKIILEELGFLGSDPRFYFELHSVFETGPWYEKFKELGIPVRVWNAPHKSPRMFLTYINVVRYLRREHFDVLHIHLLNYMGPWAGRLAGLKVITTVHNDVHYGALARFCLRQSDLLFACGAQVMRNLGRFISEKKLRLLNNAVRPVLSMNSKTLDKSSMGLRKDNKIVLTLGRLTEQKGYDLLVEAFKKVVEKEPEAVLLIGGSGPDRNKLEQQIIEAGMQQHIRLLGLVDNVADLLMICDVYVNSSRWEGLPVTILEAMAHKKPVVATNVGGNGEVIKNGETGLLVLPGQSDLLAKGILKLLGDSLLAAQLAERGFELFKKEYSIEKHCAVLASEYSA